MKESKIILTTFFVILGMITLPTIYKIYNNHNHNLVKVVKNEFWYQASICYKEEKCQNKVYLKDLYENKYLEDKLTNPLNKKYYDENSYVDIEKKEIKLIS